MNCQYGVTFKITRMSILIKEFEFINKIVSLVYQLCKVGFMSKVKFDLCVARFSRVVAAE